MTPDNKPAAAGETVREVSLEHLEAIRKRDLRHRDGRTLMKDVAEGGRDRRVLLNYIDALESELAAMRRELQQVRQGYAESIEARSLKSSENRKEKEGE